MANEYVSEGYKDRLRVAARTGRNEGVCHVSILSILQGGEIENKTYSGDVTSGRNSSMQIHRQKKFWACYIRKEFGGMNGFFYFL